MGVARNTKGSSGTLPQHSSQPPPIPSDFVAQFQNMMARERRETTTMLGRQFEAFTDLAESRDRNLRDKIQLIKNDMIFGQDDSSPSPPPPAQRSPSPLGHPKQFTSAPLSAHERENPAQCAFRIALSMILELWPRLTRGQLPGVIMTHVNSLGLKSN